jgi:HEAT repeat protein
MNTEARRILKKICEDRAFSGETLIPLSTAGDFVDDLQEAIEQQVHEKRWGCVCRLIWVAQRFPDKRFVPALSKLLEARDDDTCLEAIVDALAIMPDERAVRALTRALAYTLPGDDLAFHFNRKVIAALSSIGSEEAIAAIKEALTSPEEPIRNFAKQSLVGLT